VFAFESRVSNVLIRNVTIEKYASVVQKRAIQAQEAVGWAGIAAAAYAVARSR
jgi:hypothetical protein